jgi:hypothetical protein
MTEKPKRAKTGGRQKGIPNKATAAIREIAGAYTAEAIETLAEIMRDGETHQVRLAAANALLDRGHGRPTAAIDPGEDAESRVVAFTWLTAPNPDDPTRQNLSSLSSHS